jgi:hypothetical protein
MIATQIVVVVEVVVEVAVEVAAVVVVLLRLPWPRLVRRWWVWG